METVQTGPYGQKKLTGVVLVNVRSETEAKDVVKKFKGTTVTVAGCAVRVVTALTELNRKRNTLLRDAEKLLKKSDLAKDKEVSVKFGNDRQVEVGGVVAYQQNKWGVGGAYQGAFSDLNA